MAEKVNDSTDGGVLYIKFDLADANEKTLYTFLAKMKAYKRNAYMVNAILKHHNKDHDIMVGKLLNIVENLSTSVKTGSVSIPEKSNNNGGSKSKVDKVGIKPVTMNEDMVELDDLPGPSIIEEEPDISSNLKNMFKQSTV